MAPVRGMMRGETKGGPPGLGGPKHEASHRVMFKPEALLDPSQVVDNRQRDFDRMLLTHDFVRSPGNRNTGKWIPKGGYGKDGYNKNGYDKGGFNKDGYTKGGYDAAGYDKDGFDKNGRDATGVDRSRGGQARRVPSSVVKGLLPRKNGGK